ncbi:uncharacterized protein [Eurosta solidaginis]|uniref:uncharacterized protein n=1 Tax=Eurosta solidaginis TaxID=178769 RepID=UPI0035314CAD
MRLHKALKGDAKNAVTSLLIYPNDVPKVIEKLQFNFGRPEMLIRVQLEKVKNLPIIYENRLEPVLSFSNRVRNMVAFFKSAKCEHHLMNTMLLDQLVAKMPSSKQYEWTKFAANVSPFPTIETFSLWVSEIAMVVSLMPTHVPNAQRFGPPSTPSGFRQNNANSNRQQPTPTAKRVLHNKETVVENSKTVRLQCQQNHKLSSCHQFTTMDIEGWTQSDRLLQKGNVWYQWVHTTTSSIISFHNKPPVKPVTPNNEDNERTKLP